MTSPDRTRVTQYVLFINDSLYTHTEEDARRLHGQNWKSHMDPNRHLDPERFFDVHNSQLLIGTVDRVLATIFPRFQSAVRLRFGLDDGRERTLKEVGVQMGLRSGERPRAMLAEARARIVYRKETKSYLEVFYQDKPFEGLSEDISSMPALEETPGTYTLPLF